MVDGVSHIKLPTHKSSRGRKIDLTRQGEIDVTQSPKEQNLKGRGDETKTAKKKQRKKKKTLHTTSPPHHPIRPRWSVRLKSEYLCSFFFFSSNSQPHPLSRTNRACSLKGNHQSLYLSPGPHTAYIFGIEDWIIANIAAPVDSPRMETSFCYH